MFMNKYFNNFCVSISPNSSLKGGGVVMGEDVLNCNTTIKKLHLI